MTLLLVLFSSFHSGCNVGAVVPLFEISLRCKSSDVVETPGGPLLILCGHYKRARAAQRRGGR